MERAVKKKIKKAFYTYPALLESGVQSTVEWAESGLAVDYSKSKIQSSSNGRKEDKLCRLIDDNLHSYRWCLVIEKILDFYKWDLKERFIRLRYFERKSTSQICMELPISERTFRYWEQEIFLKAYAWAKEFNLIEEKSCYE